MQEIPLIVESCNVSKIKDEFYINIKLKDDTYIQDELSIIINENEL